MPHPAYELTARARAVVEERAIRLDWLERALVSPERTECDRADITPWRIVTAYFDRGLRGEQ